jgi:hypothetical protein
VELERQYATNDPSYGPIGEILQNFVAGTITQQQAQAQLANILPGFATPPTYTDVTTEQQALAGLYEHLGLSPLVGTVGALGSSLLGGIPGLPGDTLGQTPTGSALGAELGQLGVQPRLARDASTGTVYVADEGGKWHQITDPGLASARELSYLHFSPQDIVDMPSNYFSQTSDPWLLGQPGNLKRVQGLMARPQGSVYPSLATPIREPTSGMILPAVREVAAYLGQLKNAQPSVYDLVLKAYETAGIPQAAVEREMQFFTPTGYGSSASTANMAGTLA